MSTRMTESSSKQGSNRTCPHCITKHADPRYCPPNQDARRDGDADRLLGERRHAGKWPSGTYGHADYEIGYYYEEPDPAAPKLRLKLPPPDLAPASKGKPGSFFD